VDTVLLNQAVCNRDFNLICYFGGHYFVASSIVLSNCDIYVLFRVINSLIQISVIFKMK
jgi:hypothetical protein